MGWRNFTVAAARHRRFTLSLTRYARWRMKHPLAGLPTFENVELILKVPRAGAGERTVGGRRVKYLLPATRDQKLTTDFEIPLLMLPVDHGIISPGQTLAQEGGNMQDKLPSSRSSFTQAVRCAFSIALLLAISSVGAQAGEFQLTYTGAFNSVDSLNGAAFAEGTPFTAVAVFRDDGTNYASPVGVAGFVAYSPLWATIRFGGKTYSIETVNQNAAAGITVAVFDNTTPFGPPGHYAVGFIADVPNDGAGIVGDFVSASPGYTATSLVPTVYGDYFGVGYGPGPFPYDVVVPWVLHNGGQSFDLAFGNYEEDYSDGFPLNTAKLQAVPEPGTLALGSAGFLVLPALFRRRRRS